MTKLLVEFIILIVPDLNNTIFHPKGIAIVVAGFVVVDLWYPIVYIMPVEQRYPVVFSCAVLGR